MQEQKDVERRRRRSGELSIFSGHFIARRRTLDTKIGIS